MRRGYTRRGRRESTRRAVSAAPHRSCAGHSRQCRLPSSATGGRRGRIVPRFSAALLRVSSCLLRVDTAAGAIGAGPGRLAEVSSPRGGGAWRREGIVLEVLRRWGSEAPHRGNGGAGDRWRTGRIADASSAWERRAGAGAGSSPSAPLPGLSGSSSWERRRGRWLADGAFRCGLLRLGAARGRGEGIVPRCLRRRGSEAPRRRNGGAGDRWRAKCFAGVSSAWDRLTGAGSGVVPMGSAAGASWVLVAGAAARKIGGGWGVSPRSPPPGSGERAARRERPRGASAAGGGRPGGRAPAGRVGGGYTRSSHCRSPEGRPP